MSVMKYSIALSTMFVSGALFANVNLLDSTGTVTQSAKPTQTVSPAALAAASQNGVYLELSFGQLWSDWKGSANQAEGKNDTGGLTFTGNLGYQTNQNFAMEFGYVYFPKVSNLKSITKNEVHSMSSYALVGDVKAIVPLYSNINVFAKAGLAYRSISYIGDTYLFRPMFAVGATFLLNSNFSADMQFSYLAGDGSLKSDDISSVPMSTMAMIGLSYNFST